jgi:hypothetical protein
MEAQDKKAKDDKVARAVVIGVAYGAIFFACVRFGLEAYKAIVEQNAGPLALLGDPLQAAAPGVAIGVLLLVLTGALNKKSSGE